ncbi:type II toxin-antitoxin system VapB family antitoxin [Methyloraptor flagellatus]|uniref:Type II toxin-antitoxin system VapB family antitoxin n=1 Tax=Methyloraptor flagellatus TaxID=3162530 RepID=A0AAU7X9Z0_9HYPH
MPLYIRDDAVDALAVEVQKATGAPNKTEAVRRALANELARARDEVPLRERIRVIQDAIKARRGPHDPKVDMKAFMDEMWEL